MRKNTPVLILLALLLLSSAAIEAQNQDQEDDQARSQEELGAWIMERVIRNTEENEGIKRDNITYDKTIYKYNLEKNPPELKSVEKFNIYGRDGQSVEKLIERNDRGVTNAKPKESNLNFNSIIGERYDFRLMGEELINGKGYFLIAFKPKDSVDQLPSNDRMDEGINRMYGTLYVDIEELYVWMLEGQLTANFSKVGGLFEMKYFIITLVQEKKFEVVVPLSMDITYRYRVFWGHTYERLLYTYSNHFDRRNIVGPPAPPQ